MFKNAFYNPPTRNEKARYDVYIYYKSANQHRMEKWERLTMTYSMRRAIKYAKLLKQKHKNVTIEVKKRFFCVQEKRIIGKTVRVYKDTKQSWISFFSDLGALA